MKKEYLKPQAKFPIEGIAKEDIADRVLISGVDSSDTGNHIDAGNMGDINMGDTPNENWDW